ncbi:MAG: alpha/beta hydrolase, partial [Verrucomicrobiales bacterium]|nr:alpha/beta hydrolase [Verrucomicrobiales bacterium]
MTKSSFLLLLAVFAFPAAAQENQPKRKGPGNMAKSKAEFQAAVEIRSDIDYVGNDNPRQKLDLFLPKGRAADAEPLPLVVFIHGGGWAKGDKRSGLFRLREFLLTKKYAGASIGYRLSDEAQWPSQIHDCKAAIRWLRANAGDLG